MTFCIDQNAKLTIHDLRRLWLAEREQELMGLEEWAKGREAYLRKEIARLKKKLA